MGLFQSIKQLLGLGSDARSGKPEPVPEPTTDLKREEESSDRSQAQRPETAGVPDLARQQLHWPGSGSFPLEVVGETYHREAIAQIARNPEGKRALVYCTASLLPETGNLHDPHAVAVLIDGKKAGYLSRDLAFVFRARLSALDIALRETTCDARITNGLKVDNTAYAYSIHLDVALESSAPTATQANFPVPLRKNPDSELVQGVDGRYVLSAPIEAYVLADLKEGQFLDPWTTENWSTINWYAPNRQGIGLGHRLLSIDKAVYARVFGQVEPDAVVESIDGCTVAVSLDPERRQSKLAEAELKARTALDVLLDEITVGVVARERENEALDPNRAIESYRSAIAKIVTLPSAFAAHDEEFRSKRSVVKDWTPRPKDLLPIDRLTLLLLRHRRHAELVADVDAFFGRFPSALDSAAARRILARREKAARVPSQGS